MTMLVSRHHCDEQIIEQLAQTYNEAFSSDELHLKLYKPLYSKLPLSSRLRNSLQAYKRRELHQYLLKDRVVTLVQKEGDTIVGFVMFRLPADCLQCFQQCYPDYQKVSAIRQKLLSVKYGLELLMWFLANPRIYRKRACVNYARQRGRNALDTRDSVYIYHLAVRPRYQKQGIGTLLMEEVASISNRIARLKENEASDFKLSIMLEALHFEFYNRLSFHTLKQYMFEDVCIHIMTKRV